MELSRSESSIPKLFIILGLMLLVIGLVFGIAGGIQYIIPGWMKAYLSFEKVRPLHVSSMVFWIIAGVCGGAMTYMAQHSKRSFSESGLRIQFLLFLSAVVFILVSYISGHFGGREYWEFPPVLALLIIASWLVFLINFLRTMRGFRNQPVYVWMWLTGLCFFLFTFLESYLWLLPYFNTHIVNDMTIQW
jgi:nitric oxide reductase subunit B